MDAIVLEDVTKRFGDHTAVDGVSLVVPAGCVYGFIGPNGAGKTTTLRMILNILVPDEGRVTVLERPAGEKVKARIGYLPEERGLYRKMKLRDVIILCGVLKGRSRREMGPIADEWLERLDLSPWGRRKVEDLSRGMAQRVQFIVTVAHDPDLVILDEPFAGLDPLNADILTQIIVEMRHSGKTIIFSTHVMEQAERLSDSVFMIHRGRKVLDGALTSIRQAHGSNTVEIAYTGGLPPREELPGVEAVSDFGTTARFQLEDGGDPQALLRALAGRVTLTKFEVAAPSLHDIFVSIAGRRDDA